MGASLGAQQKRRKAVGIVFKIHTKNKKSNDERKDVEK
jgi:hypothetical protein